MRWINLKFTKSKKIILVLILINVIAFSATQSIANKYSPTKIMQEENKKLNFIEQGWQFVNWSYNLLKYFKKPHTTDTHG